MFGRLKHRLQLFVDIGQVSMYFLETALSGKVCIEGDAEFTFQAKSSVTNQGSPAAGISGLLLVPSRLRAHH